MLYCFVKCRLTVKLRCKKKKKSHLTEFIKNKKQMQGHKKHKDIAVTPDIFFIMLGAHLWKNTVEYCGKKVC